MKALAQVKNSSVDGARGTMMHETIDAGPTDSGGTYLRVRHKRSRVSLRDGRLFTRGDSSPHVSIHKIPSIQQTNSLELLECILGSIGRKQSIADVRRM